MCNAERLQSVIELFMPTSKEMVCSENTDGPPYTEVHL